MRRTAVIGAGLSAVASLALVAPAAHARTPEDKLTAIASCHGGGRVRLVTRVDAAGTEHAKATVSGVKAKRWQGTVQLGLDPEDPPVTQKLVAKHGGFSTLAHADTGTLSAVATFVTRHHRSCIADVRAWRDRLAAVGAGGGLALRTGHRTFVAAFVKGTPHHRYRFAFLVKTKAGIKRETVTRTAAKPLAEPDAMIRDVEGMPSFTKASVTITDLTTHGAPQTFELKR